MQLRQQIIEDRIDLLAKSLSISSDDAFLRFAHSLFTNQSLHAFEETDLVDGGSDKQIDVITIEHLDEKGCHTDCCVAKQRREKIHFLSTYTDLLGTFQSLAVFPCSWQRGTVFTCLAGKRVS